MSKMATQEMIDWLRAMIRGPNGEPCERCRAIAARLEALEECREMLSVFVAFDMQENEHTRCVFKRARAILDAARKVG